MATLSLIEINLEEIVSRSCVPLGVHASRMSATPRNALSAVRGYNLFMADPVKQSKLNSVFGCARGPRCVRRLRRNWISKTLHSFGAKLISVLAFSAGSLLLRRHEGWWSVRELLWTFGWRICIGDCGRLGRLNWRLSCSGTARSMGGRP